MEKAQQPTQEFRVKVIHGDYRKGGDTGFV